MYSAVLDHDKFKIKNTIKKKGKQTKSKFEQKLNVLLKHTSNSKME